MIFMYFMGNGNIADLQNPISLALEPPNYFKRKETDTKPSVGTLFCKNSNLENRESGASEIRQALRQFVAVAWRAFPPLQKNTSPLGIIFEASKFKTHRQNAET